MLFKIKHTLYLILISMLVIACQSNKKLSDVEKSEKYKEKISRQRKQKNQEDREKTRKRQYDIQAESTKKQWDINQQRSDQWRKEEYKKPLSYKIKKFFGRFHRDPKPKDGLFSKKEKNKNKKNIFQRIFKKKKKKK